MDAVGLPQVSAAKATYKWVELPAGLFWRIFAGVLDLGAVFALIGAVNYLFSSLELGYGKISQFDGVNSIVSAVIFFGYFVLTTRFYQGSLGKMALGLYIKRQDAEPLDWETVFLREILGKVVLFVTGFLGLMWVAWDANKQGFDDKIAQTVVVKKIRVKCFEEG